MVGVEGYVLLVLEEETGGGAQAVETGLWTRVDVAARTRACGHVGGQRPALGGGEGGARHGSREGGGRQVVWVVGATVVFERLVVAAARTSLLLLVVLVLIVLLLWL